MTTSRSGLGAAVVVALAATALSACSGNGTSSHSSTTSASTESSAPPPAHLVVDKADNGGSRTMNVGDTIRIDLETPGGSGYSWKVVEAPNDKVLAVVSYSQDPTPMTPGSPPIVGRPEMGMTLLRATGPGETAIKLGHISPTGGTPTETFSLRVTVKPTVAGPEPDIAADPGGPPIVRTGRVTKGTPKRYRMNVTRSGSGERLYAELKTTSGKARVALLGPSGKTLATSDSKIDRQVDNGGVYTFVVTAVGGPADFTLSVGESIVAD